MDTGVVAHKRVISAQEDEIEMEKLHGDEVELVHDLKFT